MKKVFIFIAFIALIFLAGFSYRYFLNQERGRGAGGEETASTPQVLKDDTIHAIREKIYVAVEEDGKIIALNGETRQVVGSIDLSVIHQGGTLRFKPHNVQVSPDMKTVWVTANAGSHEGHASVFGQTARAHGEEEESEEKDEVIVIDPLQDEIISRVPIANGVHLAHVVISPDNAFAYVTAQAEGAIYKIDTKTFTVVHQIPLPKGSEPHGLRISPDGVYAYVALLHGKSLGMLALQNDTFGYVELHGSAVQTGVTRDGRYVVVSLYDTRELAVYSVPLQRIVKIQLPANAKGPVQMYATPDSRFVYLADQGYYFGEPTSDQVYKIDLHRVDFESYRNTSAPVVKEIKAGQGPHGVAMSEDGRVVYVTNLVSNDVSIIDTSIDEEIARIPVGQSPNGISVWVKRE